MTNYVLVPGLHTLKNNSRSRIGKVTSTFKFNTSKVIFYYFEIYLLVV